MEVVPDSGDFSASKPNGIGAASVCRSRFRSDIVYEEINYWQLGMPTYRSFEIAHDWDLQRIGLSATSKSRAQKYIFEDSYDDTSPGRVTSDLSDF